MGKFVIKTMKNGEFTFSLKATNGQEILAAGKLPVPVKAAIFEREGGFKTVVFDLVEE